VTGGEDAPRLRRWLYTAGAVAAAVIAVVFATVGTASRPRMMGAGRV